MTSADWLPGQRIGDLRKSSGQKYSPDRLLSLLGEGLAHRLPDGRALPGVDVEDVRFAEAEARAALGCGTSADSTSFRSWIASRCRRLGIPVPDFGADRDRQGVGGPAAKATMINRMDVRRVDGVRSPASGAKILLAKSVGGKGGKRGRGVVGGPVIKMAEAQRITVQVAYPADKADIAKAADGYQDYAPAEVLERAAHEFLAHPDVGLHHQPGSSGAGTVVESHIHRGPPYQVTAVDGTQQRVRTGDWLLAVKWSPEAWPLVEQGLIAGVSVQGSAARAAAAGDVLLRKGSGEVAPGLARKAAKKAKRAARAAERAEILAEAEHYARQAARVIDPEMQAAYAGMEKSVRAGVAGEPGPVEMAGLLAKARGYRQLAARMVGPADRVGYEELARKLEQEAGAA